MRNLLRLLLVVEVDVLLHRVSLSQHIQDFPLVHSLLDPVRIALFLHANNLIPLDIEHLLAPLKGSFKFLLFLAALAKFPLSLVD